MPRGTLVTLETARMIAAGAGLQPNEIKECFEFEQLVRRSF